MRAHTHPHLYNSKLKGNTFHIWTKFDVVVGTRSMCKVSKNISTQLYENCQIISIKKKYG